MRSPLVNRLVFLLLAVTAGRAQDKDTVFQIAPVVVTPTQATGNNSPVTFEDLSRTEIAAQASERDLPVLLSNLPSMTFYSENGNGLGYSYVNLRGFDQRRIAVMVNGIPQNDPEDHSVYWIDFPGILGSTDNIQVQRGAGSAFYGTPAIGGSINLVTNPFSRKAGATLSSSWGFQEFADSSTSLALNTRVYEASVNSGLIDNHLLLYGRLGRTMSDGYRTGSGVELNSYFLGAVRIDENMTTRFHFYGGPIADGLAYTGLPKGFNDDPRRRRANYSDWAYDSTGKSLSYFVPQKPQATEGFSQPHYELMNDWKISPTLLLHNTVYYVEGNGYFLYDGDWIAYPNADGSPTPSILWFRNNVGYDTSFGSTSFPSMIINAFVGNRQWGWLPHAEITAGAHSIIVGGEVRIHRSLHYGTIAFASQYPSASFDPDFRIYQYDGRRNIYSLYGRDLIHTDDATTLMGDVQFAWNTYGIGNEKFLAHDFTVPYFFVNPRIGLNRELASGVNAYASLAYTSREPTMRDLYAAEDTYFGATPQFAPGTTAGRYDFPEPLAKPEHLLDAELGLRGESGRLRGGMNFYWMEFTDELVPSGRIDIFGQAVTGNADRTRHIGVELEGSAAIDGHFSLGANMAFSSNRLTRHSEQTTQYDSLGAAHIVDIVLDGNPIAGFPDFLGNVRASFHDGGVSAGISGKYVGSFYTDNFRDEARKNDAYAVFNADCSLRLGMLAGADITARGEVRNIFNALYTSSGDGDKFFPAAERNYVFGLTAGL